MRSGHRILQAADFIVTQICQQKSAVVRVEAQAFRLIEGGRQGTAVG